jgi:hypothetical protein
MPVEGSLVGVQQRGGVLEELVGQGVGVVTRCEGLGGLVDGKQFVEIVHQALVVQCVVDGEGSVVGEALCGVDLGGGKAGRKTCFQADDGDGLVLVHDRDGQVGATWGVLVGRGAAGRSLCGAGDLRAVDRLACFQGVGQDVLAGGPVYVLLGGCLGRVPSLRDGAELHILCGLCGFVYHVEGPGDGRGDPDGPVEHGVGNAFCVESGVDALVDFLEGGDVGDLFVDTLVEVGVQGEQPAFLVGQQPAQAGVFLG